MGRCEVCFSQLVLSELNDIEFHDRVDLQGTNLLITRTSRPHEVVPKLMAPNSNAVTFFPPPGPDPLCYNGTATISLWDGSKSPDWAVFDTTKIPGQKVKTHLFVQTFPSNVWETGYTEGPIKLGQDCARWLTMSSGNVLSVVGIDIKDGKKLPRTPDTIEEITVSIWRPGLFEIVMYKDGRPPKEHPLLQLTRPDGFKDTDPNALLANEYQCAVQPENRSDCVYVYSAKRTHIKVSL